jgi:hypothetical protein
MEHAAQALTVPSGGNSGNWRGGRRIDLTGATLTVP